YPRNSGDSCPAAVSISRRNARTASQPCTASCATKASPAHGGSVQFTTRTPAWRRAAVARSIACPALADSSPHGYAAGTPTTQSPGARAACATMRLPLTACANRLTSCTVRANRPTVSSDHEKHFIPAVGSTAKLGLKPTMPQYDAGRMVEPPVCDPIASGTRPAATAAADPDDEPPGVQPGAAGLSVPAGCR